MKTRWPNENHRKPVVGLLFGGPRFQRHVIHLLEEIMASIQELKDQVTELQAAVDADQASDAGVVAALQAQVDALTAQLAGSPSPEQLQEVIDSLKSIQADVAGPNA